MTFAFLKKTVKIKCQINICSEKKNSSNRKTYAIKLYSKVSSRKSVGKFIETPPQREV